ncbi:uncharacterized protein EAE97_001404 [Botrytis byssoidea]|uniref:Uncharacterized protein n=1 Tax=Botrytis byssoidea TaxID=139641 RepID=A0A9P5LZ38_9HELO|nr:uncharacterized protein EAE97_001404 [Botrytis byssoidea]KAF7954006.1 hypothetical protein EAE97_001404 [Botrytis byssoidea]
MTDKRNADILEPHHVWYFVTSKICCTRAYSPKLRKRSFQQLGQAMRLSKWGYRLLVTPRAWSSKYFTISTTTSPFATCTAFDREWVSNLLNGYLNISDEWIVYDEAFTLEPKTPQTSQHCLHQLAGAVLLGTESRARDRYSGNSSAGLTGTKIEERTGSLLGTYLGS